MKKSILLLAFTLSIAGVNAQKLEERYVSRILEDGILFFIKPFELPNAGKGKTAELDLTYLNTEDSVTANISVYAPDILKTDSICLDGEGKRMCISGFKTFYIDKKGKNYIHRYSCTLPFSYWKELQKNESPYTINIYSGKDRIQYGYTTKAWNKERKWMLQIIYLIERNGAIRTYNTSTIK